jgi:SnoaL-like domain
MRRLLLCSFVALAACARVPVPAAKDPGSAVSDVTRLLDAWHDAAARADEDAYFALIAEGGIFLGTDATERWEKPAFREYAHPHFAKGKAWRFHATTRHVTIAKTGEVAWFDEALATERLGPARGSGVAVREGGVWKVALYDLSIPIPNERFEAVKHLIEAK